MLIPSSRFSKTAATGIRVPRNTQAPLTFSGFLSTALHKLQSILLLYRWAEVLRTGCLTAMGNPGYCQHARPLWLLGGNYRQSLEGSSMLDPYKENHPEELSASWEPP